MPRACTEDQLIWKPATGLFAALGWAVIATWWEEQEAPRLLCCYHRFAARRPGTKFGRAGYLRYLAGNIARGLAVAQFLREHPSPPLSPLTDSAGY